MKNFFAAGLLVSALALTQSARAAAPRLDGALIQNSGSTNFTGYAIKVWSDGRTSTSPYAQRGTVSGPAQSGSLPPALTQRFFRDVAAARRGGMMGRTCMKSASFGTSTHVLWHGWTSPDLECPAGGELAPLANDVRQIVAALRIRPASRLIRMLPNEPRRAEPTPLSTGAPAKP